MKSIPPTIALAALALILFTAVNPVFGGVDPFNGTGGTIALVCPSARELLIMHSGAMVDGRWLLESGYQRRFNMSALDEPYAAAAWRRGIIAGALGVSQFGSGDFYSELSIRGGLFAHFNNMSAGLTVLERQVSFGGDYDDVRASSLNAGVSAAWSRLRLALAIDNLASGALSEDDPENERVYTVYAHWIGVGAWSLGGRVTLEDGNEPQFGLGQWVDISAHGTFFWGVSTSPLLYGGGILLKLGVSELSYATTWHPVLGFTQAISISLAVGGRRDEN